MSWIITSKTQRDEQTGDPLVWNSEVGWVHDIATIFDTREYNLPFDGLWAKFKEEPTPITGQKVTGSYGPNDTRFND